MDFNDDLPDDLPEDISSLFDDDSPIDLPEEEEGLQPEKKSFSLLSLFKRRSSPPSPDTRAGPFSIEKSSRLKKMVPAFWTFTGALSLIVNLVLITALLTIGAQIFEIKQMVKDQLLAGLYYNFMLMDEASIKSVIPVSAEVPAKFDLPLDTYTTVTLSEDVTISDAIVKKMNTGGLVISNAPAVILLPAGTELPIHLALTVPVDQMIPVNINVIVDIPMKETELHTPFVGLQKVVDPYYIFLMSLPDSWEEALCGKETDGLCAKIVP